MKFKKFIATFLISTMCFTNFAFATTTEINNNSNAKENIDITILGTSDVHTNLYGFSYEDNKETENNGTARVYTYVNQVKEQNPNIVLIDNGDTYQGTILADAVYNKKSDVIHPVSKVLNFMKYDAMVLGNHEYNFGMDFMRKFMSELEMPVLGANVTYKNGDEFAKPYTVVERDGIKIGILGLTNPNAPRWDGEKVDDLYFVGVSEGAKKYIDILKNEEKVDILFVSAHVGMVPEFDEENGSDGAEQLLKDFPEIDGLLLGHYHTASALEVGNTVVGSPRNAGRDVVQFDFSLSLENGKYIIDKKEVKTVDMSDIEPSLEIRNIISEEHNNTIDFINGTGNVEDGVSGGGIFGQAEKTFQPENEIKGIPEGKLRDTAVIDLIGKVQLDVSGADVTAVALFQDSSDLKEGDINYGNLFNIYKFDNTLYTVDVTGKELKAYMEWSAQHYNTWKEGDISISFDEDVPGYLYDMFKGVDYEINLSKPAGQRIENVMFEGKELKDDQILTLAVNNYRYSSGLKANNLVENNKKWESPMAIRDYIAEYITNEKTISPTVSDNWKITGIDLDHALKNEIISLVNDGILPVPYNKSLNIQDLKNENIIVDDKVVLTNSNNNSTTSEEVIANENVKEDEKIEKKQEISPSVESNKVKIESKTVTYTVKSGDCLSVIAKQFDVNYKDIAKDNNIQNPNLIFPGQVLTIKLK